MHATWNLKDEIEVADLVIINTTSGHSLFGKVVCYYNDTFLLVESMDDPSEAFLTPINSCMAVDSFGTEVL